jgi:hypothetical protein
MIMSTFAWAGSVNSKNFMPVVVWKQLNLK